MNLIPWVNRQSYNCGSYARELDELPNNKIAKLDESNKVGTA